MSIEYNTLSEKGGSTKALYKKMAKTCEQARNLFLEISI